jgi:hypothetical protein
MRYGSQARGGNVFAAGFANAIQASRHSIQRKIDIRELAGGHGTPTLAIASGNRTTQ